MPPRIMGLNLTVERFGEAFGSMVMRSLLKQAQPGPSLTNARMARTVLLRSWTWNDLDYNDRENVDVEQLSGARPGLQFELGELWKELVAKYLQTSRGMLEGSFWMISEHICAG